eukprot:TRINITY_DN4301_c0_g1_i1.p1 TRINITY_DN4301_c0_g1~~TRINITY_DN4301_c0_g1_i1.p1  ORF type:complete len:177 (-),score=15.06 TRINITY_DN4301_c0_g1_i1:83-613(-)
MVYIAVCLLSATVRAVRSLPTDCTTVDIEETSCAEFGGKDVPACAWVTFNATICGNYTTSLRHGIFYRDGVFFTIGSNETCSYDPHSCTLLSVGDLELSLADISFVAFFCTFMFLLFFVVKYGCDTHRYGRFGMDCDIIGFENTPLCNALVPCFNALTDTNTVQEQDALFTLRCVC